MVLSAELVDAAGQVVVGSRREQMIGREVALDLSRELFDTRLMPGQERDPDIPNEGRGSGTRARVAVVVEPDAFYVGFFETLLRQGAGRAKRRSARRSTRRAARRSPSSSATIPLS